MNSMEENKNISLITLVWPLFIQSFLNLFMGNVNVLMLSRYSDDAVGAVGVANQIINIINVMYNVVGMGTAIIISQYIGAGKRYMASKIANLAIMVNFIFGLLLSMFLIFFAKPLLEAMNIPEELLKYAWQYTVIVGGASFAQALMSTMSAIAQSYGYTNIPMFVSLGMNVINIIGNCIVIFKPFGIPSFGVPGIAVSLVISQFLGVLYMTIILYRYLNIRIKLSDLMPFPKDFLKQIITVGMPAAGEYISYAFSQMASTYIISLLGSAAITTKVYVQNLTFFVYVFSLSIGQGTQILIGYMVGAGNAEKAYQRCIRSLRVAVLLNAVMSVVCMLFSKSLLSIFTKDPLIVSAGCTLLFIDIFVETGRALNHVLASSLRGASDVRYPTAVAVISMWVFGVAFVYILGIGFQLGIMGVWIAFGLDECIRGLVLLKRWRTRTWQKSALISTTI